MSKRIKKTEAAVAPPENVEAPGKAGLLWIGVPIATLLLVCAFAGGVALRQHQAKAPIHLAPEDLKPAASAKPEPAPWTYDSVTNQYWDPAHKHWRSGHPPAQGQPGGPPKPVPDIPNPQPWQYDAATDQHFNPEAGHNHWHNGKPPADKVAAPEPAPAPAPIAVQEAVEVPDIPTPTPEPAAAP